MMSLPLGRSDLGPRSQSGHNNQIETRLSDVATMSSGVSTKFQQPTFHPLFFWCPVAVPFVRRAGVLSLGFGDYLKDPRGPARHTFEAARLIGLFSRSSISTTGQGGRKVCRGIASQPAASINGRWRANNSQAPYTNTRSWGNGIFSRIE